MVGLALLVTSLTDPWGQTLLLQRAGSLFSIYGLIVLLGSGAGAGWIHRQIRHARQQGLGGSWGGYYGVAALSIFLHAEAIDLIDDLGGLDLGNIDLRRTLIPFLIGFSVDTLMNAIWASIWPVLLYTRSGGLTHLAAFAGLAWLLFTAGSYVFPQHMFAADFGDEDADDSDEEDEDFRENNASADPPPGPR